MITAKLFNSTRRHSHADPYRTIKDTLTVARELLAAGKIEEFALESEVLLTHALKIDRVKLYLQSDLPVDKEQSRIFWSLIERRLNGEPVAYITGRREFYGLDFYVSRNVLIPRSETELLVEKAFEITGTRPIASVADIGTGSGAIAVSLAHKLPIRQAQDKPTVKIYATDISAAALKVASINCEKHRVADRITLLEGDLLDPLPGPVDLIVANLPYVREADLVRVNTHGYEPELALDGGTDGLDLIRRLATQVTKKLRQDGSLLLEIGQNQKGAVTTLFRSSFPACKTELFTDLAGVGRVVSLTL